MGEGSNLFKIVAALIAGSADSGKFAALIPAAQSFSRNA